MELTCAECGKKTPRTGTVQRYCPSCSEKRDLRRKRLWARRHPRSPEQAARQVAGRKARKEQAKEAGAVASKAAASSIAWFDPVGPDLAWYVRIGVPFSYAASKNHIYTMRRNGHRALRREARAFRREVVLALRGGLHCAPVVHNKVWVDILVQKPDHRGDAVNVIDLVCDAVKDAVGVDDRWFSIRRLDWEVVKVNPRLFVGVGQESDVDCQVCSYCGQIKPFSEFDRRKGTRLGIGRECRQCRREGRRLAKSKRRAAGATSEKASAELLVEA